MWTFRKLVALGLFLFGMTFLWMTAAMAGKTPPPSGTAWTLANVLAYIAVIGFADPARRLVRRPVKTCPATTSSIATIPPAPRSSDSVEVEVTQDVAQGLGTDRGGRHSSS
jgi:hypothetical protein